MDFPRQCGTAAVADETNIEKLKSVSLIVYEFVHLIMTYTVSARIEVDLV